MIINDYGNDTDDVILCRNVIFPFISWSQGDFNGRSKSKESKKIQAGIFLDFMKSNYLTNLINEPTRKNTILDVFLVNNYEHYNIDKNIVNKKVSDHNLISIKNSKPKKLKGNSMKSNIYSNKIFEYI